MDWLTLGIFLTFLSTIHAKLPYMHNARKYLRHHPYQVPVSFYSINSKQPWAQTVQPSHFLQHIDNLFTSWNKVPQNVPETIHPQTGKVIYQIPFLPKKPSYGFTKTHIPENNPMSHIPENNHMSKQFQYFDFDEAFGGIFLSTEEIYKTKDTCKQNTNPYGNMKEYTSFWSEVDNSCKKRRSQFVRHKRKAGCSTCCQTIWSADSPSVVEYQGKDYKVVTPPSGYQIIYQGKCRKDASCVCGECVEENSYFTWILVIDKKLKYFPPVKFIPVKYSRMCQCVNRGKRENS